ncbi:hypothetical protein [Acidithiobacillus thiooxidans]|jgi:hypothetical protein|nr:hypothetical protein [Acidithiobacillus thiooxidans]MDA8153739.1 hypothetical protein [Acidithiobacillus sp.]
MRHYKAVAIAVATSGLIAEKWELDLAAGAAWLFLQECTLHCSR